MSARRPRDAGREREYRSPRKSARTCRT